MVAKMKEGDPDALDEDIRTKINKELALKKSTSTVDETMTTEVRKKNQPAIALGTVITATTQSEINVNDTNWKNEVFISKQKTTRVGGPPKGPPPSFGGGPPKGPPPSFGGKPGAPPRGPPPTAAKTTNKTPDKSTNAPAPVILNIPKAPPISHFMAYLKGNYDPANPPSADGTQSMAPAPTDEIKFNPTDVEKMNQGEVDDMKGLIDAIGEEPAGAQPTQKPPAEMSLVEQLQA